jgi:hypothetical protein
LETALAEVVPQDVEARVRLLASLAVEILAVPGGPVRAAELAAEAVELARPAGDVPLLARALLAEVLVRDVPGGREDQLAAIEHVLALRSQGLSKSLTSVALSWRIAYRVAMAEGPVGYSHVGLELVALAEELHDPVLALQRRWASVTLAFFAADFEKMQARAELAYRHHRALGDWEAALLFVAHETLRLRELDALPDRPELLLPEPPTPQDDRLLDGARLWWTALKGRVDEAAEMVEHHAPRVLAWRGTAWLAWMGWLVDAACVAGSPWLGRLYDELHPFAGELVFRWPQPVHGAVDHYLGLAARRLGRPEQAVAHFERAVALHGAVDAEPWTCRSGVELVTSLAELDAGRARRELDVLEPRLDRLGLVELAGRARQLRERLS